MSRFASIAPALKAAENRAGQNISSAASTSLAEVLSFLRRNNKRWKGPTWRKFSTTRLDEPRIRAFMAAFSSQIEALAAWAVLEAIFNFLLRNLVFWENDPLGLSLPMKEWLNACRLGAGDQDFFFEVLLRAQEANLLFFERTDTKIFISAPEVIDDADDYTKRLLRKTQGRSRQEQGKRETTRARLARLEEQVSKLTEVVTQLVNAFQGRATAGPAPLAPEGGPSEEEKEQILKEFKCKFSLETDDWRKAVILLTFPPQTPPGPGYLAKMQDLSQAPVALTKWREKRKTQLGPKQRSKLEEAKTYAQMVRQGFDYEQIPAEYAPIVQKLLRKENGHARL